MADMSTPKEFLTEMLEVVDQRDSAKTEQDSITKELKKLKSSYESLRTKADKETADSIAKRRSDLKSGFDKQLKSANSELSSAEAKRQKELNRLMKEKTAGATESIKQETAELKTSLKTYAKDHSLPSYLAGRSYYALFCPGTVGYVVLTALFIILLFFSIGMMMGGSAAALVLLLVVIALFAAYVVFWACTRVKYRDEIADCLGIIRGIKTNESKVRDIEKSIMKAGDDSSYELSSFDEELNAKKAKVQDITDQCTAALAKFDQETAPALKAEIEQKYAAELSDMSSSISDDEAKLSEAAAKLADAERTLTSEYVSYVGSDNLTHDRISATIEYLNEHEGITLTEALTAISTKKK